MPHKLVKGIAAALLGIVFGLMIGLMILGFCAAVPGACIS